MRSRMTVAVALVTSVLACRAPGPAGITDADKAAIRATLDAYAKAALASDWDAWGKTLTTDVAYMPPNLDAIMGRSAAVAFGNGFPKLSRLAIEAQEIDGRGDMAYARGHFAYAVTMPDGLPAADSGSFLDVFRKQPDGSWLHSHAIWHSNVPLPAPPPPAKKQ